MRANNPRTLIAVGDAHGEYHSLAAVLISAGLMDPDLNWTGGKTVLLQIGDILDRGLNPLEIDRLLDVLLPQAKAAGGDIIRIVGNHELEILRKNYFITSLPRFQVEDFRKKLISGIESGKWQAAYSNKGFLFTHAGVCDSLYAVLKQPLGEVKITAPKMAKEINRIFVESVISNHYSHPIFNVSFMRGGGDRYGGIFWEDFNSLLDNYMLCPFRQIIGHTVTGKIVMTADGKLIGIDVGMKKVFEGNFEYLKLSGKRSIKICGVG